MFLQITACLLSVACFAAFAWAIRSLFSNPGGNMTVRMKVISAFGLTFFVAQLTAIALPSSNPSLAFQLVGLGLYGVAMAVFLWAVPYARRAKLKVAFTTSEPTDLIMDGPYRFVRHPFYASYLAYWLAGVFFSQRWILMVSVLVMGWFYVVALRQEEQAFLKSRIASRYRAYRARTGGLFPTFGFLSGRP